MTLWTRKPGLLELLLAFIRWLLRWLEKFRPWSARRREVRNG
ncbi:hypothetical protein [Marinobacterium aestuariivivens]|uniref:Uncharacterized protein n=1 Tax=Marinobacterium aestuariivivens TaxID=1698799 RepID=A0ABW2A729_9GAMM